jgi:hypothetical protein
MTADTAGSYDEFAAVNGFLTGREFWKAEAQFRREERDFDRLCDAIRQRNKRNAPPRPLPTPKPRARAVQRSCWYCGAHFTHAEKRGPAPRYCSNAHRAAWHREAPKREAAETARKRLATRHGGVVDLTGCRFGLLTVVEDVTPLGHRGARRWLARCDCGGTRVTRANRFKSGEAKSCGCMVGRKVA